MCLIYFPINLCFHLLFKFPFIIPYAGQDSVSMADDTRDGSTLQYYVFWGGNAKSSYSHIFVWKWNYQSSSKGLCARLFAHTWLAGMFLQILRLLLQLLTEAVMHAEVHFAVFLQQMGRLLVTLANLKGCKAFLLRSPMTVTICSHRLLRVHLSTSMVLLSAYLRFLGCVRWCFLTFNRGVVHTSG